MAVAHAIHEKWMARAMEMAGKNPAAPFGAVCVDRDRQVEVAGGYNQGEANAVLHGEMDALLKLKVRGSPSLRLALYTTAEPCPMCMSACLWSNVSQVVYGVSIDWLRPLGHRQIRLNATEILDHAEWAKVEIIGGVREAECRELFIQAQKRIRANGA